MDKIIMTFKTYNEMINIILKYTHCPEEIAQECAMAIVDALDVEIDMLDFCAVTEVLEDLGLIIGVEEEDD